MEQEVVVAAAVAAAAVVVAAAVVAAAAVEAVGARWHLNPCVSGEKSLVTQDSLLASHNPVSAVENDSNFEII